MTTTRANRYVPWRDQHGHHVTEGAVLVGLVRTAALFAGMALGLVRFD